jgi:hypothetical protein
LAFQETDGLIWTSQDFERTGTVTQKEIPLTDAQLAVALKAAARPGRTLEPLPHRIKGAAWQAVVDALVARGCATKCFFPSHVEYVLTDLGMAMASLQDCADDSTP